MLIYTLHIFFLLIRICIFSSGEKAALKWPSLGSVATRTATHTSTPACTKSPGELFARETNSCITPRTPRWFGEPEPPCPATESWSPRWHPSSDIPCASAAGNVGPARWDQHQRGGERGKWLHSPDGFFQALVALIKMAGQEKPPLSLFLLLCYLHCKHSSPLKQFPSLED